jgi:hypothetical protein
MRTYALVVSIMVAITTASYGDNPNLVNTEQPLLYLGQPVSTSITSQPVPGLNLGLNPSVIIGAPSGPSLPSTTSTVGIIRLIHVTVSPAMPSSTDPVSVKISAEASSPYLVLDRTTVDKQGSDVTIDLYWSDNPPPVLHPDGMVVQQCSLGYGIEQVSPTPSGMQTSKTYETTEALGTFSPGTYSLHIYSHGALEGEASATFQVRDPMPTLDSLFDFGDISQPDDGIGSIWDRIHVSMATWPFTL